MITARYELNTGTPATFARRLAAMFYDVWLLLAVWFFATLVVLPFNYGTAIAPNDPVYSLYLFMVSFFFYAWFWTHGGQTLGKRTSKLRIQTFDGRKIGWGHALLRFLVASPSLTLLGAGYLWMLVDKDGLSWHDRCSETVIVYLGSATDSK